MTGSDQQGWPSSPPTTPPGEPPRAFLTVFAAGLQRRPAPHAAVACRVAVEAWRA